MRVGGVRVFIVRVSGVRVLIVRVVKGCGVKQHLFLNILSPQLLEQLTISLT